MKIVSKYQKKLSFPDINLTMNPNIVITVKDEIGIELIKNPWIVEIKDDDNPPTFGCRGIPFDERAEQLKGIIEKREASKKKKVPIEQNQRSSLNKITKN